MSQLENRLSKLEKAQRVERVNGFAPMWRALRLSYGDGLEYTPEELLALDTVPGPTEEELQEMLDKQYGPKPQ